MTIIPTALGIVAGICLYAGLFHLLVGVRRGWAAVHLFFAAFSLSIAGFSLAGLFPFRPSTVATFVLSSKWQMAFLYLSSLSFIWFVAFYTGVRPRLVTYSLTALSLIILALNIASPFSILYAGVNGIDSILLPWGERIPYPQATVHPLSWLLMLALLGNTAYVYYACYGQFRRGERREALILTAGMLISGAAVTHDTLIDLEIIARSMYVLDYGFLALVVVMSLNLSDDLMQLGIIKEELVENERRWRSLLENVDLVVFGVNRQGQVDYLNPFYLKLTGFAPDEVLGRSFGHLVPERNRFELNNLFEKVMAEESFYRHYQTPLLTKSGEERTIGWSTVRLRDRAGDITGTLSIGVDNTDQLRAQAALQKSEDRYRTIVEDQVEFVVRWLPSGRLTFANESYGRHIGQSPAEMPKINLLASMSPEAQEAFRRARQSLTPENPIVIREEQAVTAAGEARSVRWIDRAIFDPEGRIAEFQSVGHDITEIKAAAAELRRHRDHLETLVDERTAELSAVNTQLEREIVERQQAEETLRQRAQELATLNQVAHMVMTVTELPDALTAVSRVVTQLFGASGIFIGVLEEDGGDLKILSSFIGDQARRDREGRLISLSESPGIRSQLARGQVVMCAPEEARRLFGATPDTRWRHTFRSPLLVPLLVRGRLTGTMGIWTDHQDGFDPGEINLAETIAGDIAGAIENTRLFAQAQALGADRERTRLAHDLHDAVTQTIYAASLIAEALPQVWRRQPLEGERNLIKLRQLVRGALAEMRALLFELRPSALVAADLGTLLRQLGDILTGNTRVPVQVTLEGEAELPVEVKIGLYRIAQEAFNNIARHAGATRVDAMLTTGPDQLYLKIWDNGRGFDPAQIAGESMGLQIMRERASAIGAQLKVDSRPGQSTEVSVAWPAPGAVAPTAPAVSI